jgi:hypothetical protein
LILTDTQRAPDELIFGETIGRRWIDIYIGAETPLVPSEPCGAADAHVLIAPGAAKAARVDRKRIGGNFLFAQSGGLV